jgi:HPt (histidine-containing phosphotransfer) domain-containing protein
VGFVASLVELFGATAPRQIEQIEAGIAAGDGNAVFRAAHQLKGSIGNFGAEAARALAAEVEELGRTGQLDLASAHLEPLRVAIDALLGALRELVVQMSATGSGTKG